MATQKLRIGKIPVTIDLDNGIIRFRAPMTIDGDGGLHTYGPDGKGRDDLENAKDSAGHWCGVVTINGEPYVRPDGFYVSTTAYQDSQFSVCDPKRYVDSERIPFISLPRCLFNRVRHIVLGSRVIVRHPDCETPAVAMVADIGGDSHIGEGSEKLAKLLDIDSNPRSGGEERAIIEYEVHAGVPFLFEGKTYALQPYRR
jgi:hypothetical protein